MHDPGQSRTDRRTFLRAALAAAGASALSACERRPKYENGKIIIDFYTYATPEFLYVFEKRLIPEFERLNPHVKVRMTTNLGNAGYDAKLLTLIAGKLAPDLFHITQQNFPFYAAKDIVLPIDDYLREDGELSASDFYPQVVEGMRFGGKLLGLPSDFSTITMLYNQDMFDQHRIAYPSEAWTWQDYLDVARKLTIDRDRDRRTDQYGTVNTNSYNRWPSWVWMNGGDILSPDGTRCMMDTPEAIGGLKFYVDLSHRYGVAPIPLMMNADQENVRLQELFISRRCGMIAESRYIYKKFIPNVKFRWDVTHMPQHKTRATTFIWGGNCIMRGTRHPREAWEFLKFMSGPLGAEITLATGNALPAYRKAAEQTVSLRRDEGVPLHDRLFIDAIPYCRQAPIPPQYAEFNQAMSVLQDAFLGLKTVEQACRQFTDEVNTALQAGVF